VFEPIGFGEGNMSKEYVMTEWDDDAEDYIPVDDNEGECDDEDDLPMERHDSDYAGGRVRSQTVPTGHPSGGQVSR
jgi:hypothetical protein